MHEGRISFILKFVTKLICKQSTHTMFENSKRFSYIILNNYIYPQPFLPYCLLRAIQSSSPASQLYFIYLQVDP